MLISLKIMDIKSCEFNVIYLIEAENINITQTIC